MKDGVSKNKNFLHDILFLLKKNILWMLLIVIVASSIGVVVAYVRKPKYIANQEINYFVKEEGRQITDPPTTVEINTMNRYIETMIEFCATEKVLDLANAYYIMYKQQSGSIDDFIAQEKNNTKPVVSSRGSNSYFTASKIKAYSFSKENDITGFVFAISYEDANLQVAQDKVRILALACNVEARDCIPGIKTYLADLDFDKTDYTIDMSKTKIVIVAAAIGVVLAVAFVFIRNLLDSTIKTKEDLERLTGATVFACIEDREELNSTNSNKDVKGGK